MITAKTVKQTQVWVSFCEDCDCNEGGFYCQIYSDPYCDIEIDNFVIHVEDIENTEDPFATAEQLAIRFVESIENY